MTSLRCVWHCPTPLPVQVIHEDNARRITLLDGLVVEASRDRSGMTAPTLYIFSGLPATGKSTIAQVLARRLGAAYMRIDTVEQALRDLCSVDVQGEGYGLAYRVVADNLQLGMSVVADSCNPIELTRREWERTARDAGAKYLNIEVTCSDLEEHRRRVETRPGSVQGLRVPTWQEVSARAYDRWTGERVVLDTCRRSPEECVDELLAAARREA